MPATPQQEAVLGHPANRHGRVIAGPGTGKSWAAVGLLERLHAVDPESRIGLLTFTRAATAELVRKVGEQGLDWLEPSTIHSFGLRVLMRHAGQAQLQLPLRIPDSWETANLVRRDLARRLRLAGHEVNAKMVGELEKEMAARWESLDPQRVMLADVDPGLRNAYVGMWGWHRRVFGYALMAEIPTRAGNLIEDFEPDLGGMSFLVVDEYQDLNRADIRLLRLLADRNVRVLGIGDDDQSIYGFRMAAPAGIAEFPDAFEDAIDYPLTVSMRCGSSIVGSATTLIETAPQRLSRPRLTAREGAPSGEFTYLRFRDQTAEARGVSRLIATRKAEGVEEKDIVVLVRSSVSNWADLLRPHFESDGIEMVDTGWVERGMSDSQLRRGLAMAHIAVDRTDSLAWWTLLHLAPGISQAFIDFVVGAVGPAESFGQCLLRTYPRFEGAPRGSSAATAARLIQEQLAGAEALDVNGADLDETGWGGWLVRRVVVGDLGQDARELLERVGREVPTDDGLAGFLGQLEPVGKDLSVQSGAVRVMSMTSSKGLTADSVFVMGVEAGIIPHPRADVNEERRLLYVAMTRATGLTALTAATRRTGPTARQGAPNVNRPRGRCPLFDGLPLGNWQNGEAYVERRRLRG